jgi:hypothetical protein
MAELTNSLIYHITHIDNLAKIVENGALRAYNTISRTSVLYVNIAHSTIQDQRATTRIPCGPGGMLHDYVPFYFAPRSPMLYTINRGNVEGYDGGQEPIVYLVSRINTIREHNLPFVFSDGHGTKAFTQFFADLADLDNIDWDIMLETYWNDTNEDGDRARRRQAEFLIHQQCPWPAIRGLAVINEGMKDRVERIVRDAGYEQPVIIRPDWYYL